jgi:uncharacterized protein (TIGR02147 family)
MQQMAFYRNCLQEELERRCEKNPRYSLRAFAKALGFEATVVSQIISGKRVPSLRTAQKLLSALGLPPDEEQHFLASLAEVHRSRGLERLSPFFKKFKADFAPQRELALDLFRVIADWYHYAILALSLTDGFKSNPQWIAAELGISEAQTKIAIDRLLKLGLLVERDGALKSSTEGFTTADKQITHAALKRHQKQILEKAIESLENDPVDSRSMTSMTMAVDPAKIPTAKQMVEEFTQRLMQFLESGKQSQVYELGITLFPLQKRRNPT